MENSLFRKESLDRLSSPEDLHDYMRVTSPRLWMLLSAILALLIGFVVFASTTVMESTMDVTFDVLKETGSPAVVTLTLPLDMKSVVHADMPVRFAGQTGKITIIFESAEALDMLIEMDDPAFDLPEGKYPGELVTESASPIRLLLN